MTTHGASPPVADPVGEATMTGAEVEDVVVAGAQFVVEGLPLGCPEVDGVQVCPAPASSTVVSAQE